MSAYLLGLLQRMADDSYREGEQKVGGVHERSKTVSGTAIEEARSLQDTALLPDLMQFVRAEKDKSVRTRAYFALGCLIRNTSNLEGKQFLVDSLSRETDTHILVSILNRLEEMYKPASISLQRIFELTDYNSRIRHAAYKALTNGEEPVEDFLLERLREAPKDDFSTLINALMYVGTEKSLPQLMTYVKSRNGWVYSFVRNAITVIMLREGYPSAVIEQKIQVSADWVIHHQNRLALLTHPDRDSKDS